MFTIRDKVVLITGGSKGIGLGIAKAFSKVGPVAMSLPRILFRRAPVSSS